MSLKSHPTIVKFLAAGAQSVAGSILMGRTTVALLRNGDVLLTPEGEAELKKINAKAAVADAVVKTETPAAPARKTGAKTKVEPPAPPVAPSAATEVVTSGNDLDRQLGELGLQ